MFVVRQLDGTLAQVPVWMCAPAAAAAAVTDRPRVALEGLRDLRLALDAILSSLSGMEEGERHGTGAGSTARGSSGVAGAGAGASDAELPTRTRAALVALMAALLLEAVRPEGARAGGPGAVVEREGRDEQDRA